MIDQQLAQLRTHRSNIQRYRNLLKTSLTELERQFVQKRLTEEQSNLESLATSPPRWLSRVEEETPQGCSYSLAIWGTRTEMKKSAAVAFRQS